MRTTFFLTTQTAYGMIIGENNGKAPYYNFSTPWTSEALLSFEPFLHKYFVVCQRL
jgi:hypothetical protein